MRLSMYRETIVVSVEALEGTDRTGEDLSITMRKHPRPPGEAGYGWLSGWRFPVTPILPGRRHPFCLDIQLAALALKPVLRKPAHRPWPR